MIHYLTDDEAVKRVFWLPEMIERIAAMLNYLMGELAGPNMSSLKVRSLDDGDSDGDSGAVPHK